MRDCHWSRPPSTIWGERGPTLLNEAGFNGDWIEKCLTHESGRFMLQEWASMVDAWVAGDMYTPMLPRNILITGLRRVLDCNP